MGDGYGKSWVHRWNAKGEYVQSWNEGKGGKFRTPHGVQIDTRGAEPLVAVADRANGQIQTFTLDGKPVGAHKEGLRLPCKVYIRGELTLIPDLKGRITLLDKEYKLIAHDRAVAAIPDGTTYEQAAASTEGGHYALVFVRAAGISRGDRVLVHGATGAIGSAAVQLLKHAGAHVVVEGTLKLRDGSPVREIGAESTAVAGAVSSSAPS